MPDATIRRTPLQQALFSTGFMALVGLAFRFIGGAFDEGFRTWAIVGVAPVSGLFTYLQASGRPRALATGLIALGIAGLLFWIGALLWGPLSAPQPSELGYFALILLFPVASVALGWRMLRRVRA